MNPTTVSFCDSKTYVRDVGHVRAASARFVNRAEPSKTGTQEEAQITDDSALLLKCDFRLSTYFSDGVVK